MSHPDEEVLADLALGTDDEGSVVRDHVAGCPVCTASVEELHRTVALASRAEGSPVLSRPPDRVWSRIEESIVMDAAAPPSARREEPSPAAGRATKAKVTKAEVTTAEVTTAEVTTLESRRPPRPRARVAGWAAGMAAAGLAVGLLTGRAVWRDTPPAPATVAQAQLDTLDTQQPLGEARVVRTAGTVDLKVATTQSLDARDGFLEVWLLNKDGKRMVSVGVLGDSTAETFPITQTLIDQGYVIVDISREGFDDKSEHSGDSLARGTLSS